MWGLIESADSQKMTAALLNNVPPSDIAPSIHSATRPLFRSREDLPEKVFVELFASQGIFAQITDHAVGANIKPLQKQIKSAPPWPLPQVSAPKQQLHAEDFAIFVLQYLQSFFLIPVARNEKQERLKCSDRSRFMAEHLLNPLEEGFPWHNANGAAIRNRESREHRVSRLGVERAGGSRDAGGDSAYQLP